MRVNVGLQGIETLVEDMVRADTEWARLGQVPGLVDSWTDVKDKMGIATEEFKAGDDAAGLHTPARQGCCYPKHQVCTTHE